MITEIQDDAKMKLRLQGVLPVILLLFVSIAEAGFYKWTDKDGNVHYSDKPEDAVKTTELIIDTESRTGFNHSSGDIKERDRMSRELEDDRKERADNREKKRLEQKNSKKKCARARDDLRNYRNAGSVYKLNSKGERVFYSKQERNSSEQKYSRRVSKYCH